MFNLWHGRGTDCRVDLGVAVRVVEHGAVCRVPEWAVVLRMVLAFGTMLAALVKEIALVAVLAPPLPVELAEALGVPLVLGVPLGVHPLRRRWSVRAHLMVMVTPPLPSSPAHDGEGRGVRVVDMATPGWQLARAIAVLADGGQLLLTGG